MPTWLIFAGLNNDSQVEQVSHRIFHLHLFLHSDMVYNHQHDSHQCNDMVTVWTQVRWSRDLNNSLLQYKELILSETSKHIHVQRRMHTHTHNTHTWKPTCTYPCMHAHRHRHRHITQTHTYTHHTQIQTQTHTKTHHIDTDTHKDAPHR